MAATQDPTTPNEPAHELSSEAIYVLQNAVVVAKPDHTRIEAPHGTDYGLPLPRETRRALEVLAR